MEQGICNIIHPSVAPFEHFHYYLNQNAHARASNFFSAVIFFAVSFSYRLSRQCRQRPNEYEVAARPLRGVAWWRLSLISAAAPRSCATDDRRQWPLLPPAFPRQRPPPTAPQPQPLPAREQGADGGHALDPHGAAATLKKREEGGESKRREAAFTRLPYYDVARRQQDGLSRFPPPLLFRSSERRTPPPSP